MPVANLLIGRLFSIAVHGIGVFISTLLGRGNDGGGTTALTPSPTSPAGSQHRVPERVQPHVRQMTAPSPTIREMERREALLGYRARQQEGPGDGMTLG